MVSELTPQDRVWNRACFGGSGGALEGDTALAALLAFHGVAMNGGVLHALESLSPTKLAAAAAGYRYFGFESVAELVHGAQLGSTSGQDMARLEKDLDHRYWQAIPADSTLVRAFESDYRQRPYQYASLDR